MTLYTRQSEAQKHNVKKGHLIYIPNMRCLCPDFPEIVFDRPFFVLELAFAESITVGIAPHFHGSECRCFMLCSKQARKMQLMTACAEFGFCDFFGIRH